MKVLSSYLERNKAKVKELFDSNCKDQQLPATKVFTFLQQIMAIGDISFIKDGKQFFKSEDNQGKIQKIIEKYYKTTPDGKTKKFFLYRISFSYDQFLQVMQYWFKVDKSIVIHDPLFKEQLPSESKKQEPKVEKVQEPGSPELKPSQQQPIQNNSMLKSGQISLPPQLRQSMMIDNEFIVDEERKPMLIAAYQGQIKKMEQSLLQVSTGESSKQIQNKIQLLKRKITQLLQSSKKQHSNKGSSKEKGSFSAKKPKTEGTKEKKAVNFKALFDFYAKQNHLTGVKASFDRIQHESQTINYQKLVHFLKQFDIFPQKSRDQKKLHNLYVRSCGNTRDLHYHQFMEMLIKLPEIVINDPTVLPEFKFDALVGKIQSKQEKNKVLHNPFHSLEKNDFRIDTTDIKYQFKIKPVKGKLEHEVNLQLQSRKKQKQSLKIQLLKDKQIQKIKKLKKLHAIDPYHPAVVKNAHLLAEKSYSARQPPVANLDNMQRFRDASFDMKSRFGIVDLDDDPMKMVNRYDVDRRLEQMEREESLKMSSLMSSIIEKSEAKLAKLGLSPRKRQINRPF